MVNLIIISNHQIMNILNGYPVHDNEDEYLDMQMGCIGIVQQILNEHDVSGSYICSDCNENISCESAVWNHVIGHFNFKQNIIVDLVTCMICEDKFESSEQLNVHMNNTHIQINNIYHNQNNDHDDSDDDDDDNDVKGDRHQCRFCDLIFDTPNSRDRHIYNNHMNYNDLLALDKRHESSDAFPGYDILIHMKMIQYIEKKTGMDKKIKECCLCYEQYNGFTITKSKCTLDIPEKNKKKIFRCDQMIGMHSEYHQKKIVPIEMKCCKADMCTGCLRNHINTKQNIICPFCNKNHTQYDKRFIIFDERSYNKIKKNPDPYPLNVVETKYNVSNDTLEEKVISQNNINIGALYRQLSIDFKDNNDIDYDTMEQMFESYQLSLIQKMNDEEDKLMTIEQELVDEYNLI